MPMSLTTLLMNSQVHIHES
uniref:Uncharacterized protein n=1 Tax=Arundo donax TaxID=35708 RepID=A0A0A9AYS5_ARUDO